MRLEGRTAVVTGAASGIGQALVVSLARRRCGVERRKARVLVGSDTRLIALIAPVACVLLEGDQPGAVIRRVHDTGERNKGREARGMICRPAYGGVQRSGGGQDTSLGQAASGVSTYGRDHAPGGRYLPESLDGRYQ